MESVIAYLGKHKKDGRLLFVQFGLLPPQIQLAIVYPATVAEPHFPITDLSRQLVPGKLQTKTGSHPAVRLSPANPLAGFVTAIVIAPQVALTSTDPPPTEQELKICIRVSVSGSRIHFQQDKEVAGVYLSTVFMQRRKLTLDAPYATCGEFIAQKDNTVHPSLVLDLQPEQILALQPKPFEATLIAADS